MNLYLKTASSADLLEVAWLLEAEKIARSIAAAELIIPTALKFSYCHNYLFNNDLRQRKAFFEKISKIRTRAFH